MNSTNPKKFFALGRLKTGERNKTEAQRKAQECGQCVHKVSVDWKGETYHGCEYKRRKFGARCALYREKQA